MILPLLLEGGSFEIKMYNSLYTQARMFDSSFRTTVLDRRESYLTSITGFYYGIGSRWNLGADIFFKSVRVDPSKGNPFKAFRFESNSEAHYALTSFVPKVKFAPLSAWKNFAMQVSLLIPTGVDFEGNRSDRPFLSYDAWELWCEAFYDLYLGESYSIFFALGGFSQGRLDE